MKYKKFYNLLLGKADNKPTFFNIQMFSLHKWKEIIRSHLIKDRVDEFSGIQESFLMLLFNTAYVLKEGKYVKDYLLLLMFPFLDHEEEGVEIKEYDEHSNKVPDNSLKNFMHLMNVLTRDYITYENVNFFFVYYFSNMIKGIHHVLGESFNEAKYYDFEREKEQYLTELNLKKFFYSAFNQYYEEINLRFQSGEIDNMHNYELEEEDFRKIFVGKMYLLRFEDFLQNFYEYLEYLKYQE
eukprot:CAMPEP_0170519794 /NCGR_PEP_ID=MMETSP0209-20121228/5074_1 /TAXON_ID=665100 ORGANISM="Litonotus pictus, Strain P1" /NCGR_SAMPLE_ID=MMETSP0209 /ASSEMBLY_ACC=CAM_ASM_000301 /LENGTH=239 /DNA_ID=CAMNT_0010805763 /DNA_START=87 /DNA_END=806 /DNA_ORIENTATION=-